MRTSTGAAVALKRFMTRGHDARARIGPGADTGSQREVEAFDQLCAIWELMLASRKGRHDMVRVRARGVRPPCSCRAACAHFHTQFHARAHT